MPIQENNIKFLASQTMDDVPEGGGAATGNEIPDGVMNNVFEDISDLDRAMGRFNLRKLFLAVRTLSTDLFGGAKTVVTALPEDPAIGYTLFTTDDPFDTREQAANRVEAYLFKGPRWNGVLYENHIAGMRQIRLIQREGTALPPRGKTLCLVQNEGEPDEFEQYVRVTDVSTEIRVFYNFTYNEEYTRMIVTLDLSDALRHDFDGHEVSVRDEYDFDTKAVLRDTTVADATRYFGAQPLTVGAQIGDLQLRAASMFTQLVPAAQSEDALANQVLNPEMVQTINAGDRDVEVSQQAHTLARQVTAENRRYNWIETLAPAPAPNALTLSYMAQGNWYTLTDDGNGAIAGSDPGFGTGTVDYETGSVTLTTGALPDAGSQVLYTYGSRVHYEARSGTEALNGPDVIVRFTIESLPLAPESLTITWPSNGQAQTASGNSSGSLSGDAAGEVDPITGEGYLVMSELPDRGASLAFDYDYNKAVNEGEDVKKTETVTGSGSFSLSAAPMPGTLRLELEMENGAKIQARDEGGSLVVQAQSFGRQISSGHGPTVKKYSIETPQTIGTVSGSTVTITTMDIETKTNTWTSNYDWTQPSSA